jgi:hypothetical protein
MSGMIDIRLADPGFLFFKTRARFRVLLDGEHIGTMRIGETASFPAPVGQHELRIAMDVGPITRNTRGLRILVASGATALVTGRYSRLWGKYAISLSS